MHSSSLLRALAVVVVVGCGAPKTGSDGGSGPTDGGVIDDGGSISSDGGGTFDGGFSRTGGLCTRDDWCWVAPLPHGDQVWALGGTSSSDVWAGTSTGDLVHFDGSHWRRMAEGTGAMVEQLCFSSAHHGWALRAGELLRWGEGSWTKRTLSPEVSGVVTGPLACSADGTAYLATWGGKIYRVGVQVEEVADVSSPMMAMSATAQALYVVTQEDLLELREGQSTSLSTHQSARIWVHGEEDGTVWTHDPQTYAAQRYHAGNWQVHPASEYLTAFAGSLNGSPIFAGQRKVFHWTGTQLGQLAETGVIAGNLPIIHRSWAGGDALWMSDLQAHVVQLLPERKVFGGSPAILSRKLNGTAPDALWSPVSDKYQVVRRWDGQSWNIHNIGGGVEATTVWGSHDQAFAFDQGRVFAWQGGAWSPVTLPVSTVWSDADGLQAGPVWAVGAQGKVVKGSGTSWEEVQSGTSADLREVKLLANADAWAIGGLTEVLRFSGNQVVPISVPADVVRVLAVDGSVEAGLYVLAQTSQLPAVLRWDGSTTLQHLPPPPEGAWNVLAVRGSGELYLFGAGPQIPRFDGTNWTTERFGTSAVIQDAVAFGSQGVLALTTEGGILHRR